MAFSVPRSQHSLRSDVQPPNKLSECACTVPPNLHFVRETVNKTKSKTKQKLKSKSKKSVSISENGATNDTIKIDKDAVIAQNGCSNIQSTDGIDHRLEAWMRTLAERSIIAARIAQRTGKAPCQLLFNRAVSVDGRDKSMVQRLLEHAERMKPSKRRVVRRGVFLNCSTPAAKEIQLMTAVSPPEFYFEISGIPECTKIELIGENCCNRRSQWFNSKTVQEGIQERGSDIKRVVPFFPDIENLQVIGSKIPVHDIMEECHCCYCDYNVNDFNGAVSVIPNKLDKLDSKICLCDENLSDSNNEQNDSTNDFNIYSDSITNVAKCHSLFWN